MAKPKVCVETTIVSYLTAWPSRDIVMHAHQQLAREWWDKCPGRYELVTSQLVVREAGEGDPVAAAERLRVLATITTKLETTEDAKALASALLEAGVLPAKAA